MQLSFFMLSFFVAMCFFSLQQYECFWLGRRDYGWASGWGGGYGGYGGYGPYGRYGGYGGGWNENRRWRYGRDIAQGIFKRIEKYMKEFNV